MEGFPRGLGFFVNEYDPDTWTNKLAKMAERRHIGMTASVKSIRCTIKDTRAKQVSYFDNAGNTVLFFSIVIALPHGIYQAGRFIAINLHYAFYQVDLTCPNRHQKTFVLQLALNTIGLITSKLKDVRKLEQFSLGIVCEYIQYLFLYRSQ